MPKEIAICWFRRDLRLHDHNALFHAHMSGFPVVPLFIFDRNILDDLEPEDARVTFIHSSLSKLNTELKAKGSAMDVQYGYPAEVWKQLTDEYRIKAVYFNADFEPYAKQRDEKVSAFLEEKGIAVNTYTDHVLLAGDPILKSDGSPYRVYTPFANHWRDQLISVYGENRQRLSEISLPDFTVNATDENYSRDVRQQFPSLKEMGFRSSAIEAPEADLSPGTLKGYEETRDYPAQRGTSRIGVHLRFGAISIREAANAALKHSGTFLNELIWREFYAMILDHYPRVVTESFRLEYDRIQWRNNEKEFELWCEGNTGYPFVDAGMRQLNQTGYMQNRVRMVTASFLTKHLLVDWRWGEQYFARKLLDYELASNNGNWQWAAGTGTDAAPYFRIFNPSSQQKKFDPDGLYVRQWIPELDTPDYPDPIVDHKRARERCLRVYKKALQGG